MTSSGSQLGSAEARRQLYDIMRQDIALEEQMTRALELGQRYLDIEFAFVARTDRATEYWEVIGSAESADGTYPVGLSSDLGTTYCRKVASQEETVVVHDAPNEGWADDPAFAVHNLHTYYGVPMEVVDRVYGTTCFASKTVREREFTEEETMFAELVARLLGYAIEQRRHDVELSERTEMVDVLCRVLRHNLRNDLNAIQTRAEIIENQLPDETEASIESIFNTIDNLLTVAEGARQLNEVNSGSFDTSKIGLATLAQECATDVESTYPTATVSVEESSTIHIRASPRLRSALQELIENAAEHSGKEPSITVSLSETDESIQIAVADDGPGLPAQEQTVLQQGNETPLSHGSGLGLWLVYWIVRRHDGRIEASVSDAGTTITITLPRTLKTVQRDDDLSPDEDE
jgi:K+-sensing histidine kinase KdpD